MDSEKQAIADILAAHLDAARQARDPQRLGATRAAARDRLRSWQSERLGRTHADLLASPRYGPAAAFFQSDLYAPHDYGDRDVAVARILPMMTRFLPLGALETICRAVELDALSESLDADMVSALGDIMALDDARYAGAYRDVGRMAERRRQIDLIHAIGEPLDALTRHPVLRRTLAVMGIPARAVGLGALHEFLERGFDAFSHMDGAGIFLDTIARREREISDRIFARDPDPFRTDPVVIR